MELGLDSRLIIYGTGSTSPATADHQVGTIRSTRGLVIGPGRRPIGRRAMVDDLRAVTTTTTTTTLQSAGTISDAISDAPALARALAAIRKSVPTVGSISISTTAGLVQGARTRRCTVGRAIYRRLPFLDLARRWLLRPYHFVAVEQAERVECQFQLSTHGKSVLIVA